MGLLDAVGRVTTAYKADISDQKAKLKELQGEERALAEARIKAAEEGNRATDGFVKKLGELGLAVSAAKGLYREALDDMQAAGERSRLEDAAHGVELEKLKAAAGGTRTEMELLTFAARTQNGAMKLNEDQMVMVQKAMRELGREGYDLRAIQDGITESLTKGTTRSLKEFGIVVDESGDKSVTYAKVLEALAAKSQQLDETHTTTSESIQRSNASMADSMETLRVTAGKLARDLTPLTKALADLIATAASAAADKAKTYAEHSGMGRLGQLVGDITGAGGDQLGGLYDKASLARDQGKISSMWGVTVAGATGIDPTRLGAMDSDAMAGQPNASNAFADGGPVFVMMKTFLQSQMNDAQAAMQRAAMEQLAKTPTKPTGGGGLGGGGGGQGAFDFVEKVDDAIHARIGAVVAGYREFVANANTQASSDYHANAASTMQSIDRAQADDEYDAQEAQYKRSMEMRAELVDAANKPKGPSIVEKIFGKKDEFNVYAAAWQSLSASVGSAYDGIVSGSESVSQAVKKAAQSTLQSLGKQLFVEGLADEARALADVFWDPPKAAGEAAAGAGLIAASVLAGVAAHELGGGGGGSSGGGGGGGGSRGGGSSGGGSGSGSAPDVSPRGSTWTWGVGGWTGPTGPGAPNVTGRNPPPTSSGPTVIQVIGDTFSAESRVMQQLKVRAVVSQALPWNGVGSGGGVQDH